MVPPYSSLSPGISPLYSRGRLQQARVRHIRGARRIRQRLRVCLLLTCERLKVSRDRRVRALSSCRLPLPPGAPLASMRSSLKMSGNEEKALLEGTVASLDCLLVPRFEGAQRAINRHIPLTEGSAKSAVHNGAGVAPICKDTPFGPRMVCEHQRRLQPYFGEEGARFPVRCSLTACTEGTVDRIAWPLGDHLLQAILYGGRGNSPFLGSSSRAFVPYRNLPMMRDACHVEHDSI
jgi:hypothetical protein